MALWLFWRFFVRLFEENTWEMAPRQLFLGHTKFDFRNSKPRLVVHLLAVFAFSPPSSSSSRRKTKLQCKKIIEKRIENMDDGRDNLVDVKQLVLLLDRHSVGWVKHDHAGLKLNSQRIQEDHFHLYCIFFPGPACTRELGWEAQSLFRENRRR